MQHDHIQNSFFSFESNPQVEVQGMSFKDISYLELWKWSRTICAILVEGIMRINSMKLF